MTAIAPLITNVPGAQKTYEVVISVSADPTPAAKKPQTGPNIYPQRITKQSPMCMYPLVPVGIWMSIVPTNVSAVKSDVITICLIASFELCLGSIERLLFV